MGILDDLGNKVIGAGQRVKDNTQKMSGAARINSLISQNEVKINNIYCQIGKLYVSIHRNDCEDEFKGMLASVAELEQQNAEYRYQLQEVKGVQICAKCGAEVPKSHAFCSSCGSAMPKTEKEPPADSVKCPSCGNWVKKGMRFCTSCGQMMAPMTAPVETLVEPKEKICPQCGEKLMDDFAFCTECGVKLDSVSFVESGDNPVFIKD